MKKQHGDYLPDKLNEGIIGIRRTLSIEKL